MNQRFFPLLSLAVLYCGISVSPAWSQESRVTLTLDKGKVDFTVQGQPAGTYHHEAFSQPFVWPVLAPGGIPMTRAWPIDKSNPKETTDHPHHLSLWFCHGDVIPEGVELKHKIKDVKGVDFWTVHKGHGVIVCTSVKLGKSGSFWNGIDTTNEWRTADGQKVLDEKRTVTLYDFGPARLWVFDIDLHASVCPITFGDTKEGAMAVRVHDTINEKNGGTIQNAEGKKGEEQCWGHPSAWCDYSGTVTGKPVGIAIFDDPKNPSPAAWHARGYGLLTANPFGRNKSGFPAVKGRTDTVQLAQGQHLQLRYGILVHQGRTEEGNVAEYYQRFLKLREE